MSDVGSRVAEQQREGIPTIEIARQLGVAQSTVHYHLRKSVAQRAPSGATLQPADIVARPRPAQSEAMTRERVGSLLSSGMRRVDIATTLGVSKSTVSYHARRMGADIDERCRRRYDWSGMRPSSAA